MMTGQSSEGENMGNGPFSIYDAESGELIKRVNRESPMTSEIKAYAASLARSHGKPVMVLNSDEEIVARYTRFGARIKEV